MCECSTIARSPRSGMTDGQEVERAVELPLRAHPKVRGGDRRNESLVERLGDPQRGGDSIPAGPQREFVEPQFSGVEDTQDLDPREVRIEQLAVLGERVLPEMPRVLRLLRARWREGQAVGRGDVGDRRDASEALEQRRGLVNVL